MGSRLATMELEFGTVGCGQSRGFTRAGHDFNLERLDDGKFAAACGENAT